MPDGRKHLEEMIDAAWNTGKKIQKTNTALIQTRKDEYKEVVLDEKRLYGGSHTLKIWMHGTKSGFIVRDCIHKSNRDFEKFEDAKIYFNSL